MSDPSHDPTDLRGQVAVVTGASSGIGATQGFGRLDVLVNNAGVMLLAPVAEADPNDWDAMIRVNLLGAMYASRAALAPMRRQGRGHVVNVSSVSGRSAGPTQGGYNASTWA